MQMLAMQILPKQKTMLEFQSINKILS